MRNSTARPANTVSAACTSVEHASMSATRAQSLQYDFSSTASLSAGAGHRASARRMTSQNTWIRCPRLRHSQRGLLHSAPRSPAPRAPSPASPAATAQARLARPHGPLCERPIPVTFGHSDMDYVIAHAAAVAEAKVTATAAALPNTELAIPPTMPSEEHAAAVCRRRTGHDSGSTMPSQRQRLRSARARRRRRRRSSRWRTSTYTR
ncbi:hypothetical protein DFH11DRAFT_960339 [Phellopilus nigrolimitatus]|nr:hypothetical protein DFH11DRAFT_960339 [Phellopilus nigrolimitatus]